MPDMKLMIHTITLRGERVTLRPMTEADWPDLLRWISDPRWCIIPMARCADRTYLEEIQDIYRTVSQSALCFIIEHQVRSLGECMAAAHEPGAGAREYPGFELRRIDLMIGEKALWGQGLGTEVIRLLTDLAFSHERPIMYWGGYRGL